MLELLVSSHFQCFSGTAQKNLLFAIEETVSVGKWGVYRGGAIGGGEAPLWFSEKGKNGRLWVLLCVGVIKISFFYIPWEGFYYELNNKKASAPPRGSAPWTTELSLPPLTIYPGAAPGSGWERVRNFQCFSGTAHKNLFYAIEETVNGGKEKYEWGRGSN